MYFDCLFGMETLDHGFWNLGFHFWDSDVVYEIFDSSSRNFSYYNPYFQMISFQICGDSHPCNHDYISCCFSINLEAYSLKKYSWFPSYFLPFLQDHMPLPAFWDSRYLPQFWSWDLTPQGIYAPSYDSYFLGHT